MCLRAADRFPPGARGGAHACCSAVRSSASGFLSRGPQRQRGLGAAIFLVILVLGALAGLLGSLNAASQGVARAAVTESALAQAKSALIGRAARDENRPGSLPCPDTDGDGSADGSNCSAYIGYLPWRTLGLTDLRDGSGARLWYALSPSFRDEDSAEPINSDKRGDIEVLSPSAAPIAQDVVALVIAPERPVALSPSGVAQLRPSVDPAQYVEFQDPTPAATGTPARYSYRRLAESNDSILPISRRDLFNVVDQAVFTRIERSLVPKMQALAANWGRYPFAMPFDPANLGARGETGTYEGSLPFAYASASPAFWLAPSAVRVGGAGTLGSQVCAVGPSSGPPPDPQLPNDTWMKCTINYTDSIALRISVVARRAGRSFHDVSWYASTTLTGTSWTGTSWGSPSASSATVQFFATAPDADLVNAGTPGTVTIRLRLELACWAASGGAWTPNTPYQLGDCIPSGTHVYRAMASGSSGSSPPDFPTDGTAVPDGTTSWQDAGDTSWILRNGWHRQLYYAIAPAYAFDGNGWCGSCLTVNGVAPPNNKRALLVFASRQTNGTARRSTVPVPSPLPAAIIADYLEDENQTVGDRGFRSAPRIQTSSAVTRVGPTVTVNTTGHGLNAGSRVRVQGANEGAYNGDWTIASVPNANSFTYQLPSGTTPSSPATGTIVIRSLSNDRVAILAP